MNNPYRVLGVHRGNTDQEIKSSHRLLCMQYHPDREGGDQNMFMGVQAAFQEIRNAEARKQTVLRMAAMMEQCPACEGKGEKRKLKNFKLVSREVCSGCWGCGFIPRG